MRHKSIPSQINKKINNINQNIIHKPKHNCKNIKEDEIIALLFAVKLRNAKRALSPVVATTIVLALITTAVGVAFLYILPAYNELKSQTQTQTAISSLYFVDQTIQDLVNQNPGTAQTVQLYNDRGLFNLDTSWDYRFWLADSTGNLTLNQGSFGTIEYLVQNSAFRSNLGEHEYFKGPVQQDYFTLNYSDPTQYSDVAIFNLSRPIWQPSYDNLRLNYRTTVTWNATVDGVNPPEINVKLTTIRIIPYGANSTGLPSFQLKMDFNETVTVYSSSLSRTGAYHLYMDVGYPNGANHTETALTHDFAEYASPSTQAYTINIDIVELRIYCTLYT